MKIRQDQLDALAADYRSRFADRVVAHLHLAYPEIVWDMPPEVLRERVLSTIDRALSYGIKVESDVGTYIDLSFDLGERFDADPSYPWAAAILGDPTLDGQEKVARLRQALFG